MKNIFICSLLSTLVVIFCFLWYLTTLIQSQKCNNNNNNKIIMTFYYLLFFSVAEYKFVIVSTSFVYKGSFSIFLKRMRFKKLSQPVDNDMISLIIILDKYFIIIRTEKNRLSSITSAVILTYTNIIIVFHQIKLFWIYLEDSHLVFLAPLPQFQVDKTKVAILFHFKSQFKN